MRVLVTGASGFLGKRLVRDLLAAGCEVTAVVRASGVPALAGLGCDVLELDLGQRGPVPDAGPHDVAFLLAQSDAYRTGLAGAADVVSVNLAGLVTSIDLARRAGVRRLLSFSSGSVYRPSFAPLTEDAPILGDGLYPMSKRMGEELVRVLRGEMELTVVRPFIVYGPGQEDRMIPDVVARVAEGRAVTLAPRETGEERPSGLVTTPCHVDDAARICVALLDAPSPEALNLAGGERISIRDLADVAGRILERDPVFERVTTPRAGDFIADVTQLEKLLAPRFLPFADGVAEVIEARGR